MNLVKTLFSMTEPGRALAAQQNAAAEQERQNQELELRNRQVSFQEKAAQQQFDAQAADRQSVAAVRAARAVRALGDKTGDYVGAFDQIASRSGSLFGSAEDLAPIRDAVAQGGPDALSAIEAAFSEPSNGKGRYISTGAGIFDTETQQIIEGTGKAAGSGDPLLDLKRENLQSQIDARKETSSRAQGKVDADAATQSRGQERMGTALTSLTQSFLKLNQQGGVVSPDAGRGSNLRARAEASGLGQAVGGALGTENQSIRKRIETTRPLLINAIRQATGMSAKAMDSNAELQFYLQAATDPTADIYSNLAAIDTLDHMFGLGGVLDKTVPPTVLQRVRQQTALMNEPNQQAEQPANPPAGVISLQDFLAGGQ